MSAPQASLGTAASASDPESDFAHSWKALAWKAVGWKTVLGSAMAYAPPGDATEVYKALEAKGVERMGG